MITPKKAIILIIILGLLVYFNSLFNGFVWDDEEEIVNNPIVHKLSNLPYILSGGTFNTGGTGTLSGWFFRPVRTLSIMINYAVWGPNPFGFHLLQVLLHLANAILVFEIIRRLLRESSSKYKLLIPAVLALVFLVHPAINEGVVYIAAASEVMYSFFNLLAFYLILRTSETTAKITKLVLVGIFLFTALLIKESAVVLLPAILIYLFIFKFKEKGKWIFVLAITLIVYLWLRFIVIQTPLRSLELSPISEASILERLLTLPLIIFSYLKIIFFPANLAISQHFIVKSVSFNDFFLPLIFDVVFFTTLFYLSFKLRSKIIFFGLVLFILGFIPISNIFPLDMTIAERWLYFSVIGLLVALAGLLDFGKLRTSKVFIILLLIALSIPILSLRTIIRNSNWKDGLTLYSHDIKINKNSFDLENNLGVELFRAGEYSQAKEHFERSVKLQPKWHFAYNNLGAVYEREKNYQKAKELYRKTLELSDYYLAYENLASLLLFYEEDTKGAKDFTQAALKKLPQNPKLWLTLALAEDKLGNKKEAEQAFYIYSRLKQGLPLEFK